MSREATVLPAAFYDRDPVSVAQALLGILLVRQYAGNLLVGRIVETEAYLAADDPASHAYRGPTPRNAAMFGPPGRAYVYFIYGRYYCVNMVTEGQGRGSAVLIRALEPLSGLAHMRALRPASRPHTLTNGPGKLCQALAIDRTLDAWDVTLGQRLWCAQPAVPPTPAITVSRRVGLSVARDLPLRFSITGHPCVSRGPSPFTPANAIVMTPSCP